MPRERKALSTTKDGRYRLRIDDYSSRAAYLYMGTKDRHKALAIMEVLEKPLAAGNISEVTRRVELLKTATDPKVWSARWNELGQADNPDWGEDVETDGNGIVSRYDDLGRLILDDEQYSPPLVDNSREVLNFLKDQKRYKVLAKNAQTAIDLVFFGDRTLFRELVEYVSDLAGKPKTNRIQPSEHRLSNCLTIWQEWKEAKVGKEHYRAQTATFNRFLNLIGDQPLNRLTKDHLLRYEKHIDNSRGDRTAKWTKDQLAPLAAILKLAMRKTSWEFPSGLREWIEFDPAEAYAPKQQNKQPIPVAVFKALLDKAQGWSNIDIDTYAATLPVNGKNERLALCNNKKQAKRIKRAGTMWFAMLKLAANVGADNVDLCRIHWDNLHLDGKLPYIEFGRGKAKKTTGAAIMRKTPLLPSTVAALLRWRKYETNEKFPEFVFSNDAKKPFEGSKISEGFGRLRSAINGDGDGWNYKHIRNIGPSIGRRNKRHPDEREAFLGHVVRGTSRFYEGDVDETYLIELVNIIGEEYFDGESVKPD